MRAFFRFMASDTGIWLRGSLGLALVALGYTYGERSNILLIIIGTIPLLSAVFDVCLLAPLFGYPLKGREIRERFGSTGIPGEE